MGLQGKWGGGVAQRAKLQVEQWSSYIEAKTLRSLDRGGEWGEKSAGLPQGGDCLVKAKKKERAMKERT